MIVTHGHVSEARCYVNVANVLAQYYVQHSHRHGQQ